MRLQRSSLLVALLLAAFLVGCTDATEPDQAEPEDAYGDFEGLVDPSGGAVTLKQIQGVSVSGVPVRIDLIGRFVRDGSPGDLALAVAIRNADERTLYPPAELSLSRFRPSSVAPVPENPDWVMCPSDSGGPGISFDCQYGYDYSELIGSRQGLAPGDTSMERLMAFQNPGGTSFSFNVHARFGLEQDRPRISGLFFGDANRNGYLDPDEGPFGGGNVRVVGPGITDQLVAVGADGRYVVRAREPGLYSLWAYPPPTFAPVEPTTSNPLEVVLVPGPDGTTQSFLHADFGWANTMMYPPVRFAEETDSLSMDPYALMGADLIENTLQMRVGFSGCSPDHPFALYMVGGFMESFPVRARLVLEHDDRGELCDAYWERDLVFDLTPILAEHFRQYQQPGMVIVLLESPSGDVYTFELGP
jgi:hypothetical protein